MTMIRFITTLSVALLICPQLFADDAKEAKTVDTKQSKEEKKPTPLKLGEGLLEMEVPGQWAQVKPRSRIVEAEFSVAAVEGDENKGRLTMMGASGGADANIARWVGQFKQADGSSTKDKTKVEEKKVNELPVHVVSIEGNFMDSPRGPFGPKVEQKNYRMLAAIVQIGKAEYYLKLYGPKKTIDASEAGFNAMVASFKGKKD